MGRHIWPELTSGAVLISEERRELTNSQLSSDRLPERRMAPFDSGEVLCTIRPPWSSAMKQSRSSPAPDLLLLGLVGYMVFSAAAVLGSSLQSVPDLENAMYQNIDGTPCVRLLNLTGEIGCANPGRGKLQAPVQRFTNTSMTLNRRVAIVLPASALHEFLYRTVNDPALAGHVAAVLVEYGVDAAFKRNEGFSPDAKFPQAEFAPYDTNYTWNTPGSGALKRKFNFPIYLLSEESTALVLEGSAANAVRNFRHPLHVAEFDYVMQTTKSGTHDSKSCLEEWSCLPLGGYSVWSSLSPVDASVPSEKPIVLVAASMDSASFFRDMSPGADSALSGMIAMLAAVDALSTVADIEHFQKQVVFAIFTGEAWGYLGSRRFLAELEADSPSVAGLSADRIHQILEVGSIGQALDGRNVTLYAHKRANQSSAETQEILNALQSSAASLAGSADIDEVKVKLADENNPGIPPSSLMALQKDDSTAGVVLEEFDGVFKNPYYHSHFDDIGNINTTALASTASVIARAVYLLGNSTTNLTSLDSIVVNGSLVDDLVQCLLSRSSLGMTCDLVTGLITPTEEFANHYVGVLLGSPSATPYVEYVDDTARFVWNFLASLTGVPRVGRMKENDEVVKDQDTVSSVKECTQACNVDGEVCVASTGQHKGRCVRSTTRFVPAYSTRLQYTESGWRVIDATPGDVMSEADPVWTESFWNSISLRLYLEQSSKQDNVALFLGCCVTVVSFVGIVSSKTVFWKRLKRD